MFDDNHLLFCNWKSLKIILISQGTYSRQYSVHKMNITYVMMENAKRLKRFDTYFRPISLNTSKTTETFQVWSSRALGVQGLVNGVRRLTQISLLVIVGLWIETTLFVLIFARTNFRALRLRENKKFSRGLIFAHLSQKSEIQY